MQICTKKETVQKNVVVRFIEKALGLHFHQGEFATNEIRTAKYTLLTFLPVNLFEQFMRVANLYFLIMAILQLIPGLSPTSWFTTVCPLVIVLTINGIKEGADDYYRHVSDNEINARTVTVLEEGGKETQVAWRDLAVGDIVRVRRECTGGWGTHGLVQLVEMTRAHAQSAVTLKQPYQADIHI